MIFGSETKLRCTIYQFLFLSPAAAPEDDPSRGFILQPAQSLARPGERRVIISVPCSSRLAGTAQKNANARVFMKALEFISFAKKRN